MIGRSFNCFIDKHKTTFKSFYLNFPLHSFMGFILLLLAEECHKIHGNRKYDGGVFLSRDTVQSLEIAELQSSRAGCNHVTGCSQSRTCLLLSFSSNNLNSVPLKLILLKHKHFKSNQQHIYIYKRPSPLLLLLLPPLLLLPSPFEVELEAEHLCYKKFLF